MPLDHDQMHTLAHGLMDASAGRVPVEPLTEQAPGITPADAYDIAADIIGHKLGDGRRVVGKKVGLTGQAMRELLGIDNMVFGIILDDMTVRDGGRVRADTLIAPTVEPEIAFRLKSPLKGPGVTAEDVIAATDYVFPALEIVDSRIKDWRIKEADITADNGAAAMVVLGSTHLPLSELELASEEVVLELNGAEAGRATGAEVLGNPVNSVVWCANKLAEFGLGLAAGEFVMPGSLTRAPSVKAGDSVSAAFANLGVVSVRFT